jgi:CDP-diacylglycerol--glycerol-3-phosphate 3-phosphatidyltransferase
MAAEGPDAPDAPDVNEPEGAPAASDAPPLTAALSSRSLRAHRRRTLWEDAKNLPNFLTFLRVLMIPVVLLLLARGAPRDCYWAAWVYALAAITDLLDGWLARRSGLVTMIGKFLDPLADKLIVVATLVWMVPMGRVPAWAVVLLICREITITALRSIAGAEGLVIAAGEGGKAKTALQMIGIICLLLGYPYEISLGVVDFGRVDLVHVGRLLIYCSLFFSITSAAHYMGLFADAIDNKKGDAKKGDARADQPQATGG